MLKFMNYTLLFLAVVLVFSCGDDSGGPTGPKESERLEPVVAEKTKVVEQEKITEENVSENEITYTYSGQAPDIAEGDVLVSGTGDGYLKKVDEVTVEADKITVKASQAALVDAVEQGEIDTTFVLDYGAGKAAVTTARGVEIMDRGFSLDGFKIVDEDGMTVTITNGAITFVPSLDIDLKIRRKQVEKFHALVNGSLTFDFDVEVSGSKEMDIFEEQSLFGGYPLRTAFIQWIGPVPVVEVVTFDIKAGIVITGNANGEVTAGFDQNTTIETGARYDSGTWTPVWEKEVACNGHGVNWNGQSSLNMQAYVRPVVSVDFYAVAGPYIDVVPYLSFDGETGGDYRWRYELVGGVSSNLGFEVSILEYSLARYDIELAAWETMIASDYQEWGNQGTHEIQGMTFVTIPGDTFRMGDISGDGNSYERPVHDVTISSFEMGATQQFPV